MDNTWLESILQFNKLRNYLETKIEWSNRVKDILSLEFLLFMVGVIGHLLAQFLNLIWNSLFFPIENQFLLFVSGVENGEIASSINVDWQTYFKLFFRTIVAGAIFFLLAQIFQLFLKRISEKNRGIAWCIYGLVIIIASVFVCSISWKVVIIFIPILALVIYKIPLGNGKYLKILRYLDYFFDTYKGYSIKEDIKQIFILITIWIVLFFALLFSIQGISVIVAMLVSTIIILVVLKNLSLTHTKLLVESVIYIMLIPIVVVANETSVNNVVSLAITFGTIYFAIDRIFALGYKAINLIRENSILYYVDEGIQEIKKCKGIMYPISYFQCEGYSEKEIVRQIIYFSKLGEEDEIKRLYELYEASDFTQYLFLVGAINYYFIFDNGNFPEDVGQRLSYLKQLFRARDDHPQCINYIPINFEYVCVLNERKSMENSKLIVKLLSSEDNLNENYKRILSETQKFIKKFEDKKIGNNKKRNLNKQRKNK